MRNSLTSLEALASHSSAGAQRAWLLARAAELTSAGASRDARSLAAARAAFDIRDIAAARTLVADVGNRANGAPAIDRAELEGRLAVADGRHLDGARMLRAVAAALAGSDPPRAVRLYVAACYILSTIGHAEEARELARVAAELPSTGPVLDLLVASAHAEATAASGRFTDAERMFRQLAESGDRAPEVHADREARLVLVEALYSARQFTRARQVATAAARDARTQGALGDLRLALACLFSVELSTGRFDAAEAAATEELELARGLGRLTERREALGHVAWCHAFKGEAAECRSRVAERVALSEEAGLDATPHGSLGLLELGLGNVAAAADVLRASELSLALDGFTPAAGVRPCALDLVEALVRKVTRTRRARCSTHSTTMRGASIAPSPEPSLIAAAGCSRTTSRSMRSSLRRCVSISRSRARSSARVRSSAGASACAGAPTRRRTCAAARRSRRLCAAGARLWAERAELELVATGERARVRRAGSGGELTPTERRVAVLVSEGLTNREVAARLFVSVNTVETHLRHLFQKLGVRSRTELAGRFTDLRDSNEPVPS